MKKRIRKKLLKGEPLNYYFWCVTIENRDQLNQFLDRGNNKQKEEIMLTLEYMKKKNSEKFNKIGGNLIIKELNSGKK